MGVFISVHFKVKGFMLLSAVLTAILFILLSVSFMSLYGSQFSLLEAGKNATAAQKYAEIVCNTLSLTSYDELKAQERRALTEIESAAGWESEIALGLEKEIGDGNKQRIATVRIYKSGETLPRYTQDVPLSTNGSGSCPIGAVIAWSLQSDPDGADKDKWLECNGQAVDATKYPKLAKKMSHVPDYRGIFLRGYGTQNSYHYGAVAHQSAGLGEVQGDAIRNITGAFYANNVSGWGSSNAFAQSLTGELHESIDYKHQSYYYYRYHFDAGQCVPTANENRPVNVAVRYMIKAR